LTQGMRLLRRMDLPGDEEDQDAPGPSWCWYTLPRTADDDGSKSSRMAAEWGEHTRAVERAASRFAEKILTEKPDLGTALVLAAKFHDLGKRRAVWQRSIGNDQYPAYVYAKSGRLPDGGHLKPFDICPDYRHELGSVLDIPEELQFREQSQDVRDLILHLIASGHGRGRPHFPADEAFDPEPKDRDVSKTAVEVVQRFAQSQRKYGRWGLAYIESVLRAADYAASVNPSAFLEKQPEDQR
jgi:CRISPR-associated endonuclease/helicase Cas3